MGLFSRFEDKAENIVEGSTTGRGGIEPVKLAKRAAKEMEREKMVGVGHEYAPTLYNVLVSPEDDDAMSGYYPSLAGEMETYLSSRGQQSDLVFDCPPLVRFIVDDNLKRGKFDIIAESVSPAIIKELRHEEMLRYGIEAPASVPARQRPPRREPEPEPEPEPVYEQEPAYDEPDYYDDEPYDEEPYDERDDFDEEPQVRNYPPTEAPIAAEDDMHTRQMDEVAAAQTRAAVLYDLDTRKQYHLSGSRTIIGRERDCDVILTDPSVSRRHAEILRNETGWLIRDTGSTNGTKVNGVPETQSRIYDGDLVDLGNTRLEFQEG